MAQEITISNERLREVLDYNPETGDFIWLVKTADKVVVGTVAGGSGPNCHRTIMVEGNRIQAARLAWFWVYGVWPKTIRFKDKNPANCAISNLLNIAGPGEHVVRNLALKKFGLDVFAYQDKLIAQNGVCSICEQPERNTLRGKVRNLAVDHDHMTGETRDLLCSNCNLILGHAGDSEDILLKAIAYLRRHKKADTVVPLHLVKDEVS